MYEHMAQERDKLILSYLPMVRRIAARLFIPSPEVMDRDDLVSQGLMGLLDAIEKYDPARESSFSSYAYRRIRGAMVDSIRALSFSPRSVNDRIKQYRAVEEKLLALGEDITELRMAEELGLSLGQVRDVLGHMAFRSIVSLDRVLFSEEGEEVAVSQVIGCDNTRDPSQALEDEELKRSLARALDELPERDRMMLNMYYVEELTLREIAAVFGVTEGRVSQLHSRAITRLRSSLGENLAQKGRAV